MIAAQLFLEGDGLEAIDALGKRRLLIEVPEEARIFEACAQYTCVAVANDVAPGVVYLRVEHGKEVRGQFAVRAFNGEVLLVIAHDGDEDFFRQREVFSFKLAENNRGPLGKVNNRFDQRFVFAPACAGDGARGRIECLANRLAPLGDVYNDFGAA